MYDFILSLLEDWTKTMTAYQNVDVFISYTVKYEQEILNESCLDILINKLEADSPQEMKTFLHHIFQLIRLI